MSAQFQLFNDSAGQYRFRLLANNHEIVLASEAYTRKASAQDGIDSVRENAPNDGRYERKLSSNGRHLFNLRAANHEVIGTSELYETEGGRDNGITVVKQIAPDAPVVDKT